MECRQQSRINSAVICQIRLKGTRNTHLRRSSMSILAARLSIGQYIFNHLRYRSIIVDWLLYLNTNKQKCVSFGQRQGRGKEPTIFCNDSHVDRFYSSIFMTPFAWKLPRTVLFGRKKIIRFNPSNSSNLTGGGGSIGTRRTTEDSTCGGGLKSFRDTLIILSTLAYN
jgi:hypothetical protein